MVAFMHTGTRLTAGYRYTTLGDATPSKRMTETCRSSTSFPIVIDYVVEGVSA